MVRGRKSLAAFLLTILMLCCIIIPSLLFAESLYEGINYIREIYLKGEPLIPPPSSVSVNWPNYAKPLVKIWQAASDNIEDTAMLYSGQITIFGTWLLSAFAGISKGVLQFIVSIVIAGFLLNYSASLEVLSDKIFMKLAGNKGGHFAAIIVVTIRNIVKGFIGVAIIQAILAGIGFYVAGIPFAGLWTIICLVLSIIQMGILPVIVPVIIYMFATSDTTSSIFLTIWMAIAFFSESVLKPVLLGKNAPVPMPVVFLGAIGGFIYNGFIGLFLGAVILTIGYQLFMDWLGSEVKE